MQNVAEGQAIELSPPGGSDVRVVHVVPSHITAPALASTAPQKVGEKHDTEVSE